MLEIIYLFQEAGGKMGDMYKMTWYNEWKSEYTLHGIKITF